jgi:hypothetical protein
MIEKSDREELERRLEQAKRIAALLPINDVTHEHLQKRCKSWRSSFANRSRRVERPTSYWPHRMGW